jgi:hypothetical protein
MSFPILFPKCPKCGSTETLSHEALAGEPSVPQGTFLTLEQKITPLQDFLKISTPTTKVLLRYYDTCAKCGLDRCTRADKTTMPTDVVMRMMGMGLQTMAKR